MGKLMLAAIAGAALALAPAAQAQPLGIGTSPQGTMVYTLGATLSKALADSANMQSRVQPQSGTGTMVPLVNSGEIDIGFCNAREFYDSFKGVGSSEGRPNPNLRAMAVLFPLQVGLIVRNDSPIKSAKDVKGKSIAYGYASHRERILTPLIREAIDQPWREASWAEAIAFTEMILKLGRTARKPLNTFDL